MYGRHASAVDSNGRHSCIRVIAKLRLLSGWNRGATKEMQRSQDRALSSIRASGRARPLINGCVWSEGWGWMGKVLRRQISEPECKVFLAFSDSSYICLMLKIVWRFLSECIHPNLSLQAHNNMVIKSLFSK